MLEKMVYYETPNRALWQGRIDSLPKERFFQHVHCEDIHSHPFDQKYNNVLLGFCSDEGIRRNEGRVGAAVGPDSLRKQLAKLACHTEKTFLDIGNIFAEENFLEDAQTEFASLISHCHQQGLKTMAFGGGHEIAFGHFLGLAPHYKHLGIINFDAHFDLRPLKDGRYGTSGTPFWQIEHHCQQQNTAFSYCCLGIQPAANTKSLFERAQAWNVDYLTASEIKASPLEMLKAFLDDFLTKHEHIYLTICLDVFAESYAPGVSAPQALGLSPAEVTPLLKYIMQSGKVVSTDIAELSPSLDRDEQTSRLAAMIIAELLNLKD